MFLVDTIHIENCILWSLCREECIDVVQFVVLLLKIVVTYTVVGSDSNAFENDES